jgi:heme-degrading monooxygenase HmoA
MFARIGKAEIEPGRMDEAVTIWRERVMPQLRQQPGFHGAIILGDGRTTAEAITFWASEADAQAAGMAMQAAIGQLGGPLAGFPHREAFEVYLDERA